MSDQKTATPKKRGRPPKQVAESNTQVELNTSKDTSQYENCSYSSVSVASNYCLGLNIFDLYSPDQIQAMVKDPITNNEALREVSAILYGTDGTYTNCIDYMTALLTLDRVIVTRGASEKNKIKNKKKVETTLRLMKDKEFVRDALFTGMVEGIAFYYFETSDRPIPHTKYMTDYDVNTISEINDYETNEFNINVSTISLPAKYTKIVGRKNSVYVLAFDLTYFNSATGETQEKKLRKYPKEIREAFYAWDKKPSLGNWVVLDSDKTITFKIRSKVSEPYGRPVGLAAISEILYKSKFRETEQNAMDELNNRVIYQTFPEGAQKGLSALTGPQQRDQHEKVKNAILNKNNRGGTSFFSVSAGTKIQKIDTPSTDIFDEKYNSYIDNNISRALGMAGSLLDGTGSSFSSQTSNVEMISAQLFMWLDQIEAELNKCINVNIVKDKNNRVEVRYLHITNVNKESTISHAKELYLQGKGSLSLWAASCGVAPDVFFALLDEELEQDVENRYPVHKTSYTASAEDNEAGRPKTDNPTDKTMASRSNNGNNIPSPSDSK